MQMAAVDAGESKVFATLGAATNLLLDLEAVDSEVGDLSFPAAIFTSLCWKQYVTRRCGSWKGFQEVLRRGRLEQSVELL